MQNQKQWLENRLKIFRWNRFNSSNQTYEHMFVKNIEVNGFVYYVPSHHGLAGRLDYYSSVPNKCRGPNKRVDLLYFIIHVGESHI